MNHRHAYGIIILFAISLIISPASHAYEGKNPAQETMISQLTDYCTKYSKYYLETYLSQAEERLSDNDKYQMLGEIFSTCLRDKSSELKNQVKYDFQNEFYLY